jgi:hypothetical protein
MRLTRVQGIAFGLTSVVAAGCASWDNPTALSELNPEAQFEIESAELETFQETEIHVRVNEGGAQLELRRAQLEIERADGGAARTVEMDPASDGYEAHVTFYEPGEHHFHLKGVPSGHHLMIEMGEHEVEVRRHHQVIGPYWTEFAVSPAPVFEGDEAHVHLFVFALLGDGTRGDPVGAIEMAGEIHAPDGTETELTFVEEEVGEYEADHAFGEAGEYELHIEIDTESGPVNGEFHMPVLNPDTGDSGKVGQEGGHGHG